jgi:hypothetical protein
MSRLYKKIILLPLLFFIMLSVSYGEEIESISYNNKGILATEWSSFHDVVFAIVVIFVVLLIIVFMRTPDDIV